MWLAYKPGMNFVTPRLLRAFPQGHLGLLVSLKCYRDEEDEINVHGSVPPPHLGARCWRGQVHSGGEQRQLLFGRESADGRRIRLLVSATELSSWVRDRSG